MAAAASGPAGAQRLEAGPAALAGERDAEEVAELAVEVGGEALLVLELPDHDVAPATQAIGEEAQDDALAGAGLARDPTRRRAMGHKSLTVAPKGRSRETFISRVCGCVGKRTA